MAKKYYKPGRPRGTVTLHRRGVPGPPVTIPPEGLLVTDKDLIKYLDDHELKGQRRGYIEVEMPEQVKKAAESEAAQGFKDVPEDAEFPYGYGGGMYYLSNGDSVRGLENAQKAEANLYLKEKEEAAANSEPKPTGEATVVEEVTNLNELKDYLMDERGVDGRSLNSKEKIEQAAAELDPPAEFPNYE